MRRYTLMRVHKTVQSDLLPTRVLIQNRTGDAFSHNSPERVAFDVLLELPEEHLVR